MGKVIERMDLLMNMVMDISDRILVLNCGKVLTHGPPKFIQKHPEVLKVYLGKDYNIGSDS